MATYHDLLPVALTADDWSIARQDAQSQRRHDQQPSYLAAPRSPVQVIIDGDIGQIAWARVLGVDHVPHDEGGGVRMPDVADDEVKCNPFRNADHFYHLDGGNLWVPGYIAAATRAIVRVTYYEDDLTTAYVNGWVTRREALRFPLGGKVRGGSNQRAHMVPFAALHPIGMLLRNTAGRSIVYATKHS